ncbi:FAD:protein FMN transferase [Jiangella endophytica]|uniref:FAD:protein FMN transferase n=1 Tax=Jiangella endophytica TaxID=1623398 RepID=UPI000E34FF07|nr:FAD:protein FMN transferase [Jiangella endophytica]
METARHEWPLWSTAATVVTAPEVLEPSVRLVEAVLAEVDAACSRYRDDSELARADGELARGVDVSPMLATLVEGALEAARCTDGDVDPTLGAQLDALGFGVDVIDVPLEPAKAAPPPDWTTIRLRGRRLTVPGGVRLDLGASGKALAADLAAHAAHDRFGAGVLVSLGGDIATAGAAGFRWQVVVRDTADDPAQQVSLRSGWAMATSSTRRRRHRWNGREVHHIVDPRTGLPAEPVWRSATVVAPSCLLANAYSTAAVVRGHRAPSWLASRHVDARLVGDGAAVVTVGRWPDPDGGAGRE